jgi:hypothetical protein
VAPRTEAEDYRNVEDSKIEGRGTVHEHTASLRALRLAKEAADKEAAEEAATKTAATKNKKPPRLPQNL